ncbi:hypothetical protein IWW38_001303 [Coemansia aciculifera]|uniref:Uncharacterized protein n=1 Tax=Coemansia aciculifera TaxID=417176 RepID=A0ACC1M7H8_9FUNG|nr:hypothetical protein IWW38_001303 [Coemansia aciculifera]
MPLILYLGFDAPKLVIDPESIRWVNLTILAVYTPSYQTLCKLVARLHSLTTLEIESLELGDMQVDDFYMDDPLFRSMDPLLAWGERLVKIIIASFKEGSLHVVQICGIQALIVNAGALVELKLPDDVVPAIKTFIDNNKKRFAHMANISIL